MRQTELQQEIYDITDNIHVIDQRIDQLRERQAGATQQLDDADSIHQSVDEDWRRRAKYCLRMTAVSIKSANADKGLNLCVLSAKRSELSRLTQESMTSNSYTRFRGMVKDYLGDDAYYKMTETFNN